MCVCVGGGGGGGEEYVRSYWVHTLTFDHVCSVRRDDLLHLVTSLLSNVCVCMCMSGEGGEKYCINRT